MTNRPAIESLMGERGRLRTVHEMLKEALEITPRGELFVPFYIAVGRYMQAAMGRLDVQDIKMLARLGEKLGEANPDEEEVIAEVHRRLDGNREHLKKFAAATNALEAGGADHAAIENYESTASPYIDYIHNDMGHHAPSTELARRLFDESDWLEIADIDDEYFAAEAALYAAVLDARPASVPLGKSAEDYVAEVRHLKV